MPDATAPASKLLMTSDEAATSLSVCTKTLRALVKAGELKAISIGRAVRFDRRDLVAWIDSRK
jgi:excisionase family DNA binding protein